MKEAVSIFLTELRDSGGGADRGTAQAGADRITTRGCGAASLLNISVLRSPTDNLGSEIDAVDEPNCCAGKEGTPNLASVWVKSACTAVVAASLPVDLKPWTRGLERDGGGRRLLCF